MAVFHKHRLQTLKLIAATWIAVALAACGGGGTNPEAALTTGSTVLEGSVQSGIVVPSEAEVAAANVSADADGLVLRNLTGVLARVSDGQVVYLPINDAQGIPLGFSGKAKIQPDGSIKLLAATVGDVFKTLKLDFDSTRDGGLIAGLVVPKNGAMNASLQPAASLQSGLEYATCQLGLAAVVDIKCGNGTLEGNVTLEHPLWVKKKGSEEKVQAQLYVQLDLRKMAVKTVVDFDEIKYATTGGMNKLEAKVQGEWGVSMGVRLTDDAATAEIPSFSEIIRADGANIWDDNTKVRFGKYFELSGLNGDDKKGLIPLGGIYLTPANSAIGGQVFSQELSAAQLGQIKAAGVILWLYIDASGNITLSGDLKLAEVTGAGFERGFSIQRVDGELSSTFINARTTPNAFAPRIKGKIEAMQNFGLAVAADVLVAGIRPATVKSTLLGVSVTGDLEGDGGYRWSPQPTGLQGNVCSSANIRLLSDFLFRAGINARLDTGWIALEGKAEFFHAPDPLVWWEDNRGGCNNSFNLDLMHVGTQPDIAHPGQSLLTLSFANAYNNATLREQVGRWRITETGGSSTQEFDADSSSAGVFTALRPPGTYTFVVTALHKNIMNAGQPVVVAQSSPVVVTVSARPTVDFTAALLDLDCKRLQLTSQAVAGPGANLVQYAWSVKPVGANAIMQTGPTATFTLASCGTVDVTHSVVDNLGGTAFTTRSLDTESMTPAPPVPNTGTFTVFAHDEHGTLFTAPSSVSSCSFVATGVWAETASGRYGPNGLHLGAPGTKSSTTLGRLIVFKQSAYVPVGTSQTLTISTPNETMAFLMNDVPGSYGDNVGSLTVNYTCQ